MMKKLLLLSLLVLSFTGFAQLKPLIKDGFNALERDWPVDNEHALKDGAYVIHCGSDGSEAFVNWYVDYSKDFEISADFVFNNGSADAAFGISWGTGTDDYNVFLITPDGSYGIHSGVLDQLKGWKKFNSIKAGGQVNTLRVVGNGVRTAFFINGQPVEERKPMPAYGPFVGVLVLDEAEVAIDNFALLQNQDIRLTASSGSFSKKENLGQNVNTAGDELGPLVSVDGKLIYFSRQRVAENVGGAEDPEDVWYSRYEGGSWTTAKNMGRAVNTSLADNLVAVSTDNNSLIFEMADGLSIRHRAQTGWTLAEKLGFTFKNETDHVVGCLSADGKAFVFSAKMKANVAYDAKRDESDLYITTKVADKWSPPVNLGRTINSSGEETSPFLSADGRTLYFATNGRPGFGDQDIFVSTRTGSDWTTWTEPENLGPQINSAYFDAYYTLPASGDNAYFVSFDHSFGEGDIFRIPLHQEARPQPVILVRGKVLQVRTKEPLAATIHFENLATGSELGEARSDPRTGAFQIVLPFGLHYGLKAKASGFYAVHENIELLQSGTYQEVERDIVMVPIQVGETVKLNNIFFEPGSPNLKQESYPELDHLISLLKDNPGITIELAGHTDNLGDESTLMKLSQDRVASVRNYLISKGIDGQRIPGKGYGASQPVAPSNSEENRRLNRRVEFKITKK